MNCYIASLLADLSIYSHSSDGGSMFGAVDLLVLGVTLLHVLIRVVSAQRKCRIADGALETALVESDAVDVTHFLHRIHSSLAPLADVLRRLEQLAKSLWRFRPYSYCGSHVVVVVQLSCFLTNILIQ